MSSYLTLIIFVVIIVGLLAFSRRARSRQAAQQSERAEQIGVGTEVMTTSGLYGTVTARNDDDSVQLRIAPEVEVRWALAALREIESLPPEFQGNAPATDAADDWSDVRVRLDKSDQSDGGTGGGFRAPGTGPATAS